MARGSISKRELGEKRYRWDVVIDLGPDPVTGKRRQERRSFTRERDAIAHRNKRLAEVAQGTAVERSAKTMGELMAFWLDNYARHRVSAKSYDGYAATVRLHIVPSLGNVQVQRLTAERLQAFYTDKINADKGPRTVELCHLHISQALDQAVKLGWVPRNVADQATPPRWKPREMETWTPDEARRFVTVARESYYGPIWLLALSTGMRKGELLGLRWGDIDHERAVLTVRQTVGTLRGKVQIKPPKTANSRREVHVPAGVLEALRAHRRSQSTRRLELGVLWADNDLVFTAAHGEPIHPDNLDRDFDRLVKRAGIKRIRIHDLRHTFATTAIREGISAKVVSESLGHADVSTTLRTYIHVVPTQRAALAATMGAVLFGTGTEAV